MSVVRWFVSSRRESHGSGCRSDHWCGVWDPGQVVVGCSFWKEGVTLCILVMGASASSTRSAAFNSSTIPMLVFVSVVSEVDLFVSSTGNFNIIILDHMKQTMNNTSVRNFEHSPLSGSEDWEDVKVDCTKPRSPPSSGGSRCDRARLLRTDGTRRKWLNCTFLRSMRRSLSLLRNMRSFHMCQGGGPFQAWSLPLLRCKVQSGSRLNDDQSTVLVQLRIFVQVSLGSVSYQIRKYSELTNTYETQLRYLIRLPKGLGLVFFFVSLSRRQTLCATAPSSRSQPGGPVGGRQQRSV